MSASGLVVSRAALSLHRSDDSLCSRDLHVKRRSSGNDVTLTVMLGSLCDHKQHSRCRSVADLSKRDVDTGDKALSTACQRDVPPSPPLQVRGGGGEVPVDAGCHSNFNNNLDYCYIWNTCTGTATCDSVGDARAPVLPPKQRKSSCRRPYGDTSDSMSIRHVSQSLDQLHVIGGRPVGLSLLPADNDAQVCGSVAALEGTAEEWKRGEGCGVPPLPPPPRPLRKSSASSSNSSTLPKPTNRSTSSSTTARPVSAVHMTTTSSNYTNNVFSSSPPVSTMPPSLPRKTRPRQLSSTQEGAMQRSVNSVDLDSPSPTTNVLRPRSGREYAVPDRRRLAEEFGSKLTSATSSSSNKRTSAPVTSPSSIFTFDSTASSNATVVATSATSSTSDSNTLPSPSNDVIGSSPSNGFASSSPGNGYTPPPRPAGREYASSLMHLSPPPHPHQHQSPSLNYIQLDHPGFGNSSDAISDRLESSAHAYRPSSSASVPTPSATSGVKASGGVDYAVIDLVATVAASRVGREHVKQREDALKARLLLQDEAKDGRHLAATDTPPPRSGSRLTPSSKHNSRTSLPGSKDSRKLSLALSSRETSQRGWSDQRKLSSQ